MIGFFIIKYKHVFKFISKASSQCKQRKQIYMFIHFLSLCPFSFAMKLDFSELKTVNIAKKYYKTQST